MVVEDDRIVYVGSETDAPAADSEIDLAGRRVLPGFIDGYY
jgi:imidazolonepropionase-like amidohydrolase